MQWKSLGNSEDEAVHLMCFSQYLADDVVQSDEEAAAPPKPAAPTAPEIG